MNSVVEGLKFHSFAIKTEKSQFNSDTFKPFNHGRNLVVDTEDVTLTFSGWGYIICHVHPTFFLFRFCIWRGLRNKNDVCHVLCEELFMLGGRLHIAKFMLKQSLVFYH